MVQNLFLVNSSQNEKEFLIHLILLEIPETGWCQNYAKIHFFREFGLIARDKDMGMSFTILERICCAMD